jgi:hypothetical protein
MEPVYSKWFRLSGQKVRLELPGRFNGDKEWLDRCVDNIIEDLPSGVVRLAHDHVQYEL